MPEITVPAEQVFPTLRNNILVDGFHIVIDLKRSHGTTMIDALEGKEYLDCYAYFASLPIGHNHPKMAEEGFRASLLRAALNNPANSDVYTREYAGFVSTLREIAVPPEFRYLFFVAGGALAVENAMKVAFDWKSRLNRSRGVERDGHRILHFREAFHGRSGYTLSVTNTEPTKTAMFPKFDWPRVSNPKVTFPIDERAAAAAEAASIAEIEEHFAQDPHGIAAILIEPVQGEGGDNQFRPAFLKALRAQADKHDALLIFDEVQTGVGATGRMWAFQNFGVVPDLLVFGKKMQVCGLMSTTRVDSVKENVFHVSSRINSTWGGNLVDMVRGARYLQIIREDALVENAAKVGGVFLRGLQDLAARHAQVSNPRGLGLMLAFDVADTASRNALRQKLWDNGLATLACGSRSIRFRPALIFSESDVARTLQHLHDAL